MESLATSTGPTLRRWYITLLQQARREMRHLSEIMRADWRGPKYLPYGAALALITTIVTTIYYLGMPYIELDPDTRAYLGLAQQIAAHGQLVDAARLPGYPLLIAAVFAIAGKNNLAALSIVQAILFIVAAVELYVLACLILRRAWAALLVALLIGANTQIISYVKPILSEGLSLFLTVTLALAVALAIHHLRARSLWAVAFWSVALFITRPEWIYLPILLFAYLLFLAARRGLLRRLLPHTLAALLVMYAILGLYIHENTVQNKFAGVTYIQNINLLGKVMQYHMEGEAPPEYADVTPIVESFTARGDLDPWHVLRYPYAPIQRDYFARLGAYSEAIILHHPGEYLADSTQVAFSSVAHEIPFRPVFLSTPFTPLLLTLGTVGADVVHALVLMPFCALFWWLWELALLLRRRAPSPQVETLCAVALLTFYGLAITTLGGYVYYGRLHTPFTPLSVILVGSTLALALLHGASWLTSHFRPCPPTANKGQN